MVNYKSDSKNNLIIALKNKSGENINANSLAIFKEGSKTGELIR
ncbi:lipoprotein, putative [Borreliella bavariensis PBi]|uniref:Lipoprotein, putative n=1 Tax=Borrelia garinii subsp. bavariensis (strain ATCC BAA-2496 / DSM 23469 / PBi) TaxID=290434 RepID=A0A7I6GWD0_BORGP|nr:lipoprotein, putative [Borreliella bavariensis PBi]